MLPLASVIYGKGETNGVRVRIDFLTFLAIHQRDG
jgi:hypothetical protein